MPILLLCLKVILDLPPLPSSHTTKTLLFATDILGEETSVSLLKLKSRVNLKQLVCY